MSSLVSFVSNQQGSDLEDPPPLYPNSPTLKENGSLALQF